MPLFRQLNEAIEFTILKRAFRRQRALPRPHRRALDHPAVPFLWCRRGMWRPVPGATASTEEVISTPSSNPATSPRVTIAGSPYGASTFCVEPILPRTEPSCSAASFQRAELGLDPDRPAAGPACSTTATTTGEVLGSCAHAEQRNVQLAVAEWLISEADERCGRRCSSDVSAQPLHQRTTVRPISAVGYNSFHELIACAVPAIFIPNEHPTMDDQLMRAQFAERRGLGGVRADLRPPPPRRMDRVLDLDQRERMISRCRALAFSNGGRCPAHRGNGDWDPRRPAARWESEFVRRI